MADTQSAPDNTKESDVNTTPRGVTDASAPSPEDERISELMAHSIDVPVLASALQDRQAADAADVLEDLEDADAASLLAEMDDQNAADALAEMEAPLALGIVQDLIGEGDVTYAGRMLSLMASDDAADILQGIPEERREAVLGVMPFRKALGLRRLIGYHEETAGGLMTTDVVALRDGMTVGEATEVIRARQIPSGINHLVVVTDENVVVGIVGLRSLLIHADQQSVSALMTSPVRVLRAETDQEEVAREFDRYDFAMMPVVDEADRLLGIVTFDDIIDTIRAEQTEDVQMSVGAGKGEAVYSTLQQKLRGRVPWLLTSLVLTLCASGIILTCEEQIRAAPILAMLLPVNAAIVGNAGHQALAVTLRGIILDEVRADRLLRLIVREGFAGLLMGMLIGLGVAGVVSLMSLFEDTATLSAAIAAGSAMVIAMGVGTLAGSGIPLVMRRLGVDPAQSSTIFLIMITDFVSFGTLLLMSRLLL